MADEHNSMAEKLSTIRFKIVNSYPFFANLLFHLPLQEDASLETFATDGCIIAYNPQFAASLQTEELAFVLLHETMHVALGHLWRRGDRDHRLWNIATDYVINIMLVDECVPKMSGDLGLAMPRRDNKPLGLLAPEYRGWSAERVYKELRDKHGRQAAAGGGALSEQAKQMVGSHDMWGSLSEQEKKELSKEWTSRVAAAATAAKMAGKLPAGIETQLGKLLKPQKDWRLLLREFIETENYDFSWTPPDKRFPDSDFFMPDFNEKIEIVKDLYFFIDASGSMSDEDINKCASEIQGAIYQFKNHLHGKLAYFDTQVYKYYDFDEIDGDIAKTRPAGRGGTEFAAVFKAVAKEPGDVAGIVILSDGYCEFPPESAARGLPVLWIFTTPDMKAPYGQYTTLE